MVVTYSQFFHMNNYIYGTLFKTQERESDRSKEIEQRKESQKNAQTKQQGHVKKGKNTKNNTTRTCDPKYLTIALTHSARDIARARKRPTRN